MTSSRIKLRIRKESAMSCQKQNYSCNNITTLQGWPQYKQTYIQKSCTRIYSDNYVTLHWPCRAPLGPISTQIKTLQHSTWGRILPSGSVDTSTTYHKKMLGLMSVWVCVAASLTSARAWRRSWCCHRRLFPGAPWSSAPSAPPGFPSPFLTPAAERGSGWWRAMQVRKRGEERAGEGGGESERENREKRQEFEINLTQ